MAGHPLSNQPNYRQLPHPCVNLYPVSTSFPRSLPTYNKHTRPILPRFKGLPADAIKMLPRAAINGYGAEMGLMIRLQHRKEKVREGKLGHG